MICTSSSCLYGEQRERKKERERERERERETEREREREREREKEREREILAGFCANSARVPIFPPAHTLASLRTSVSCRHLRSVKRKGLARV